MKKAYYAITAEICLFQYQQCVLNAKLHFKYGWLPHNTVCKPALKGALVTMFWTFSQTYCAQRSKVWCCDYSMLL